MKKIIFLVIVCIITICLAGVVYYFCFFNKLEKLDNIKTDPEYENVVYDKVEDIMQEDVLGILEIEKIGLKATVKDGSDQENLANYIGHIEGTSIYDGNIGLAGHNRGYENSYFARINELKEGDKLEYKTKFYTREYIVDNILVIHDTDWSLLENTKENRITMITCVPNKPNQRLCIQAIEIGENA